MCPCGQDELSYRYLQGQIEHAETWFHEHASLHVPFSCTNLLVFNRGTR